MHQFSDEPVERSKSEKSFLQALENLYARMFNGEDLRSEEEKMLDTIRMAHDEWKNAEAFFQDVTDPDLIDHAIYRVQAAKTKYRYLMKLAREMGIKQQNFQ
ncbi:MAG TPA: YaaL family protein [Clostridiales bacterium]|nr:YaaL family protein [Clostridiales bacterium]